MIAKARSIASGVTNLRFVLNEQPDLGVFDDKQFDLVASHISHLPATHAVEHGRLLHHRIRSRLPSWRFRHLSIAEPTREEESFVVGAEVCGGSSPLWYGQCLQEGAARHVCGV
jgi:hypothetical protein